MKNRPIFPFAVAAALLTGACSDESVTTTAEQTETKAFRFSTGKFEVPPGDRFECFYTDTITEQQLNVRSASGKQGPGGHHITVYWTDQKVPVGHHECNDMEMIGFHQIAGASDGKEAVVALPDGYATKVPAGKQLVVQSHYIVTGSAPIVVEDEVELHTLETGDVKAFANAFVMNDGTFSMPARSTNKSATDCVVPRDFDVLLLLGHMHEWGSHYKLERVDETGKAIETLYETGWEPLYASHPPVTAFDPKEPLKLTKGTRLRQTCEWKNTEDHEMAFPREMCVMFSYYIPDDGFIICDTEVAK